MQTEISDITRSHGPWNQCLDDGMNETGNISVRNHVKQTSNKPVANWLVSDNIHIGKLHHTYNFSLWHICKALTCLIFNHYAHHIWAYLSPFKISLFPFYLFQICLFRSYLFPVLLFSVCFSGYIASRLFHIRLFPLSHFCFITLSGGKEV